MAKPNKALQAKLKARKAAQADSGVTKKKKVRAYDLSADAPWDDDKDVSSGEVIARAEQALTRAADAKKGKGKKGRKLVRDIGMSEDEYDEQDAIDQAASMRFRKGMARVAKRVSNKAQAYNSPAVQELVTREILASLLRQLPKAEANYKASGAERAAYAYTNLNNQVRDLMADLRAMSSTDALADQIVREAIAPAFMQLVNYIVTEVGTMRSRITSANDIDVMKRQLNEQLNKFLIEIGNFGDETLEKAAENSRKALKV